MNETIIDNRKQWNAWRNSFHAKGNHHMANDNLIAHAIAKIAECELNMRIWKTKTAKWRAIAECKNEKDAIKTQSKFRMVESLIRKGIDDNAITTIMNAISKKG